MRSNTSSTKETVLDIGLKPVYAVLLFQVTHSHYQKRCDLSDQHPKVTDVTSDVLAYRANLKVFGHSSHSSHTCDQEVLLQKGGTSCNLPLQAALTIAGDRSHTCNYKVTSVTLRGIV